MTGTDSSETRDRLLRLIQVNDLAANRELQGDAGSFLPLVPDLEAAERARLVAMVQTWWPARTLGEVVTTEDGQSFSVPWPVTGFLLYGPVLRIRLAPRQWVDIAICPVYQSEHRTRWLQEQATVDCVEEIARRPELTKVSDWSRILESMPAEPPAGLLDLLVARVTELDADGQLESMGFRLVETGATEALVGLGARGPAFRAELAPFLAATGDAAAQEELLQEILSGTSAARAHWTRDYDWLNGVEDRRLLPLLFDALVVGYRDRESVHAGPLIGGLERAIRKIGGVEALDGYDALVSAQPEPFVGAQFLRYKRAEVAEDLLRSTSEPSRVKALQDLGLPIFETQQAD